MGNSIPQGSDTQHQPSGFWVINLQVLKNMLNWLAGLFQMTEEEQTDAGIYLGNQRQ
jgi:hypothetical protein